MSRNISSVEKIIILILVMGAVLGAGYYFIVRPAYDEISVVDRKIEEKEKQIEAAEALRLEEDTLKISIVPKRERAKTAHEGFYDEMTTTEAVTMIQDLLRRATDDGGYIATTGVKVTEISEAGLQLQLWLGSPEAKYALRNYANAFVAPPPRPTAQDRLREDPDEGVWEPERQVALYVLGPGASENDIEDKINEFKENQTLHVKAAIEMLKNDDGEFVSDLQRVAYLEMLRSALATKRQGVGYIKATFTIEMNYSEFLDFLDYLYSLGSLEDEEGNILFGYSSVNSGAGGLYESIEAEAEISGRSLLPGAAASKGLYSFELGLYVLKPMEIPDNIGIREEVVDNETEDE
ncbi:MAG: hypothetical protein FWG70_00415 [Oscillospiraceae bacterium]|nr:hypothetical protein [Oscillospiraceae bacterium]